MTITRRDALTAVVGCGLATQAAGADEKPAPKAPPRDPLVANVPAAARKVFEDTFPGHRCIRMARRGEGEKAVYRGTFFNPADTSSTSVRQVGEASVRPPPLYHLEVDVAGKVVEETHRPIDPKHLPKAVQTAYEKWNPNGVEGRSGHFWVTEVPKGKVRIYHVNILLSAVKAYRATFQEDGTVVAADPAVIP